MALRRSVIGRAFSPCVFLVVAALAAGPATRADDGPQLTRAGIEAELGVFIYPKADQDPAAQDSDSAACYASAESRTHVDPKAPAEEPAAAPEKKRGGALKGAAGGALRGAALGAIVGEAGDGAALGAAGGAMHGRRAQKKANRAAEQRAQQATVAAADAAKATFQRAFTACMDARNYSVQ